MNVKSIFYMTTELTSLLAKDATNVGELRVLFVLVWLRLLITHRAQELIINK
jgi:hypothetical protein